MSTNIALTYWEAAYTDGRVIREPDGITYVNIPRDGLEEFRLVMAGGSVLFSLRTPPGATGRNLRYRITTDTTGQQMFRLGWEPHGPAFLVDPAALDQDRPGVWIADQGFHEQAECRCDQPHPIGWFSPPEPMGGER